MSGAIQTVAVISHLDVLGEIGGQGFLVLFLAAEPRELLRLFANLGILNISRGAWQRRLGFVWQQTQNVALVG
jgi:hypothetical protein